MGEWRKYIVVIFKSKPSSKLQTVTTAPPEMSMVAPEVIFYNGGEVFDVDCLFCFSMRSFKVDHVLCLLA